MPGPPPKAPELRQRRNRTSTATRLPAEADAPRVKAPPLPVRARGRGRWHARTRAWWADLWRSPMAATYLRMDVHGLFVLAELIEEFWRRPCSETAAEIRLQRRPFGLTPEDRRRLQWEIDPPDEGPSAERGQKAPPRRAVERSAPGEASGPAEDPRGVLRAVT